MDDTLLVGGREGVRDLGSDAQRLLRRQRALPQPVGQGFAVKAFHHEVVDRAALWRRGRSAFRPAAFAERLRRAKPPFRLTLGDVTAHVVERADVRVVQCGDRLRLAFEARAPLGVGAELLGQDLDGDVAVEARVAGSVNLSHPAGTDGGQDLIRAEPRAGAEAQSTSFFRGPVGRL
jgi:hypothetical protein